MSRVILSIFLTFTMSHLFAQQDASIWYFGSYSGLDFRSGMPVPLHDGQLRTDEGCATVNDQQGNLLFYTNGEKVWNRSHQVMPNGSDLMGGYSSTESAIVVPFPGTDSLYYIFTTAQEKSANGFRYSVVSMNRNGGLGDVITKNVLLLTDVYEKVTAVKQQNCYNYWVVTRKWDSDEYYSYLITASGVSSPVVSKTGNYVGGSSEYARGQLKFSPNGKKIAAAFNIIYDFVELLDFDHATGKLSNLIVLSPNPKAQEKFSLGTYGVEFSPNNQLLYVSSNRVYSDPVLKTLHQYNISSNNQKLIEASKILLDDKLMYYGLQLGPDKKIYVSSNNNYLNVINHPDIEGLGCDFNRNFLDLGASGELDFPAFIQSYFKDPIIAAGDCEFQNISFSVQNSEGVSTVFWDFGDPDSGGENTSSALAPTHRFSRMGSYRVRLVLYSNEGCAPDTIFKQVQAGPLHLNLGRDTVLCKGDTLQLAPHISNAFHLWSTNSTDSMIKVVDSGKYWLKVSMSPSCQSSDTIQVLFKNLPLFSLGKDTALCLDNKLLLTPQPGFLDADYHWNTGATTTHIEVNHPGVYWLVIKDATGCVAADSVWVTQRSLPQFSLGKDTSLCQTSLQLNAAVAGASNYQWSTGANTPQIHVNQSGVYWATVIKEYCQYRDSIQVRFKPYPVVSLGGDTTLCEDTQMYLDAGNVGATYQWNDKSNSQFLQVNEPGTYVVEVSKEGCVARDTIAIRYDVKPSFTLGPDQVFCSGQRLTLSPLVKKGSGILSYLWQDGTTSYTYNILGLGIYSLRLSNHCGVSQDSVIVKKGVCKLYIPNAFTPNGDGINDVFRASFGENVTSYKLEVFNRWGDKVFESVEITKGWQGWFNGKMQPAGVYIWVIRYKTLEEEVEQLLKGTVTLVL